MNLKFRKYRYGGSYSEEELLLPDNSTLSTINIIYGSYRVYKEGDIEEWTKDYIITCEFSKEVKARLEESYAEILFYTDNAIVAILSEVYITSNFETIPLSNLNNILDGLFFEFQEDNDTELSKLYRECDIETYVKEANCPDLGHIEFTKKLVECLNISDVCDNNYDRALELDGWIKFSSGRWLYMKEDFKPSKAQLQIIFKWAHDKADDFRVYLGNEFVNLDVLQCKINSAE